MKNKIYRIALSSLQFVTGILATCLFLTRLNTDTSCFALIEYLLISFLGLFLGGRGLFKLLSENRKENHRK